MPAPRLVQGQPPTREPVLLVHQVSGTFLQSENQSTTTLNDEVQNFHAWSAVPTTIPAGDIEEEDAWLVGEDEGAAPEPRTNM